MSDVRPGETMRKMTRTARRQERWRKFREDVRGGFAEGIGLGLGLYVVLTIWQWFH